MSWWDDTLASLKKVYDGTDPTVVGEFTPNTTTPEAYTAQFDNTIGAAVGVASGVASTVEGVADGSVISNLLPSKTTVVSTAIFIVIVLILVLLILGKVDSL